MSETNTNPEARAIIGAFVATVGCIPTKKTDTPEQEMAKGTAELRSCFMIKRGEACECLKTTDRIIAALAAEGKVIVDRARVEVLANCLSDYTVRDVDGAVRSVPRVAQLMITPTLPPAGDDTP